MAENPLFGAKKKGASIEVIVCWTDPKGVVQQTQSFKDLRTFSKFVRKSGYKLFHRWSYVSPIYGDPSKLPWSEKFRFHKDVYKQTKFGPKYRGVVYAKSINKSEEKNIKFQILPLTYKSN